MPAPDPTKQFGAVPDDPRAFDKAHKVISSELKNKGKSATKDKHGVEWTDQQWANAEVIAGAAYAPPAFTLACPPIGSQGGEGSCVSWACAYYQFSIEHYYRSGASSFNTGVNVFSPEYIFDQVQVGNCDGSTEITNLNFLQNNGCILWDTMPYVDDGACVITPTSPQIVEAASYKIGRWSQLSSSDVAGIKAVLMQNHPVSFAGAVDSNMYYSTNGYVWETWGTTMGGHGMCIIGWDDTKGTAGAWKVANQWGTGWSSGGYIWMGYGIYPSHVATYGCFFGSLVPSNVAPIANAGFDRTAPVNTSIVLDGTASSDPDGYIASYLWEKVSGPSSPTINNATSAVANITPTVAGTYVYKLTVTDNSTSPLSAYDWVTITVSSEVADTLTLSVTKATAKGKVTDTLVWNIVVAAPPISAELQVGTSAGSFGTLFPIQPYRASGSYSYLVSDKRVTRYYRLKVVKSDGTIITKISTPEFIK